LGEYAHVKVVYVKIIENQWDRMQIKGQPHPHSFLGKEPVKATVSVVGRRDKIELRSGIKNLFLFKTTASGFEKFWTDKYTTLPSARDRLFKTLVTANWNYNDKVNDQTDYKKIWRQVIEICCEIFATNYSPSVQASLYQMGREVVKRIPEIDTIFVSGPNLHNWTVNLAPLGEKEPNNEVYTPTMEPMGYITATIARNPQPSNSKL